jgi:hypothetical protein
LSGGQHALTVVTEGAGTVSIGPRGNAFASGSKVTLTAVPDAGQQFRGWNGEALGSQNPLVVAMDASKVIGAQFTQRPVISLPSHDGASADGFQFQITGGFNVRYQVETTDDWHQWSSLAVVTNPFGATTFKDRTSANRIRNFYRVVTVP